MKAWEGLVDGLLHLLVFGPDYGETVMVREPGGGWIVVDSLARTVEGRRWIPAVETLRARRERWGCVVLTHPHQDHAAGIAEVLDEPGDGLIGRAAPIELAEASFESPDVEEQLAKGQQEDALVAIAGKWRANPASKWLIRAGDTRCVGGVDLDALYPRTDGHPATDRNRRATPLLVRWRDARLLLGSDLTAAGWNDLAQGVAPIHHDGYKVAHHASANAFVDRVHAPRGPKFWVATPYSRARKLPRFEDGQGVAKILARVEELHLTGVPFALPRAGRWPRSALARETKRAKLATDVVIEITGAPRPVDEHWVRASFDASGGLVAFEHGPGAVVVIRDAEPARSSRKRRR